MREWLTACLCLFPSRPGFRSAELGCTPGSPHPCCATCKRHQLCSGMDQVQKLFNAHDGTDQGHQEWIVNGGKCIDWLALCGGIADFHHGAVPEIAVFVEHEDTLCLTYALQMTRDGVSRLVCGHGVWITTRAWQGPPTADASRLERVSELDHLLVESEATTDTD